MDIAISSCEQGTFQGSRATFGYLRLYANGNWVDSEGFQHVGGAVDSNQFFESFDLTIDGDGIISIPSINIQTTTDAVENPNVRITAAIYTGNRKTHSSILVQNVFIPTDQAPTTTWENIREANQATQAESGLPPNWWVLVQGLFGTLTDAAQKASRVIFGTARASVDPASAADPIFVGDNDPRVGGVIASYTKAALPVALTGQDARVTDSTRGIWRYDAALAQWIPTDPGRRISLLDFCNPVTDSDCTAEIQAAINALQALGGGTIDCPAGFTFRHSGTLSVAGYINIMFEGTNTRRWLPSSPANFQYTGTGSKGWDFGASNGCGFKNLNARYTNVGFTGTFIDFDSGSVAQDMSFENCVLGGTEASAVDFANPAAAHADNAAIIIDFGDAIIGRIDNCHFVYGAIGMKFESTTRLAGVFDIWRNRFNYVPMPLYSLGYSSNVQGNVFEPDLDGKTRIHNSDLSTIIKGLTFENNWCGDTVADDATPKFKGVVNGGTFANNYFQLNYNATAAIELQASFGVEIAGNFFESLLSGPQVAANTGVLLDSTAGTNKGIAIHDNVINLATPITNSSNNLYEEWENYKAGVSIGNVSKTYMSWGNGVQGTVDASLAGSTVLIGEADTATLNTGRVGSAIRRVQSAIAGGFSAGGLIIQSRTDSNSSEISFLAGTSTTPRFRITPISNNTTVPILFTTDNSYDLGAAGATRPRTGYFGTSVVTPLLSMPVNGAVVINSNTVLIDNGSIVGIGSGDAARPVSIRMGGVTIAQFQTSGDFRITSANVGTNVDSVPTLSSTSTFTNKTLTSPTMTAPVLGVATGTSLAVTGLITSSGTAGIGYATGAGGTITQGTSRVTTVILNKTVGEITLFSAAGSATAASFTVTNSTVAATDRIILNQKSGTDKYVLLVTALGAGSFEITFYTTGGTTTEQPVIGFTVIKGVAA